MEQWNHGFWNIGMVGLENQNEHNCIDLNGASRTNIHGFKPLPHPTGVSIFSTSQKTQAQACWRYFGK
jgi:hypothetical protein